MSEQSISDKSQIIRNETQQHANTRGRVADVIDDINATKANKTDVTDVEGDISTHLGDFNNPHQVTKSQVGLGNADNTSDINKPISNAVQLELDKIATEFEGQTNWNESQDGRLDQLEQHNIDQDAALGNKANTDASNISEVNTELWRKKLNVPQIPDSVISIGAVTADSSTVYLALPLTGKNTVLIDGQTYERTDPQSFPFTPVTTGEKILIIHALPDSQVFHLVQGAESTEAVEPSYSGLFVARLLVTTEGIDIVEATSGFREKAVDNFAIFSLAAGDRVIGIGANMRLKVQSSGAVRIGGFVNEEDKIYSGCPISVRNDTPFPMEFYNAVDASPEFIAISSADLPFSIKPGETANFAYRGDGIVEIIKTGGSGGGKASEVENDSTVTGASVKDALETQAGQITDLYIAQAKFTVTSSITNETLSTVSNLKQNNRNNLIANGVNAINITLTATAEAKFQAIYHKLGSGTITFVAGAGVTLVLIDGTDKMEGAAGFQTAAVHRDGNKYYVQISNR